jgi:hypothetical protein
VASHRRPGTELGSTGSCRPKWRAIPRGKPTDSNRRQTAVDGEVDARDEACLVGGEEEGSSRDLLRAAEPLERDPRGIRGLELRDHVGDRHHLLEDRCVDRARANRIDPDATIRQLGCP